MIIFFTKTGLIRVYLIFSNASIFYKIYLDDICLYQQVCLYVKSVSIGGKSGNYFKDRFSQMIQISEKLYFWLAPHKLEFSFRFVTAFCHVFFTLC